MQQKRKIPKIKGGPCIKPKLIAEFSAGYKRDLSTVIEAIRGKDEEFRTIALLMPICGALLPFMFSSLIDSPGDYVKTVGAYNGLLFLSYYDNRKVDKNMGALLRVYIPISLLTMVVTAMILTILYSL